MRDIPDVYSIPNVVCKNCGSINDFRTTLKSNQLTAWCNCCNAFIKNIPYDQSPKLYFGKYKGREISSMKDTEEIRYLQWLKEQTFCKNNLKQQINSHLLSL